MFQPARTEWICSSQPFDPHHAERNGERGVAVLERRDGDHSQLARPNHGEAGDDVVQIASEKGRIFYF
jgi:hypothetical protein